jgi:predicted DNA-binding protein (MmcQ/YjbR family)
VKTTPIRKTVSKTTAIAPERIALYDKLIATNPSVARRGDTNPYTSHNGHMFTHLSPPGTLAVRLSPEDVAAFLKKYKTKLFETYGVVKNDWVVVPDSLLQKTSELRKYFEKSYEYVKTLKPKPAAKKN